MSTRPHLALTALLRSQFGGFKEAGFETNVVVVVVNVSGCKR